jgi:hypothetical protein
MWLARNLRTESTSRGNKNVYGGLDNIKICEKSLTIVFMKSNQYFKKFWMTCNPIQTI